MYAGRFARRAAAFLLSDFGAYAARITGLLSASPGIVDWLLHVCARRAPRLCGATARISPLELSLTTATESVVTAPTSSLASSGAAAISASLASASIVPSASSRPVSGFVGFAAHRSAMRRAIAGASFRSRSASNPCSNALRSSKRPGAVHSDTSSPRSHLSTNCLSRLLRRFGSTTDLKNAGSFSCRKKSSSCEA